MYVRSIAQLQLHEAYKDGIPVLIPLSLLHHTTLSKNSTIETNSTQPNLFQPTTFQPPPCNSGPSSSALPAYHLSQLNAKKAIAVNTTTVMLSVAWNVLDQLFLEEPSTLPEIAGKNSRLWEVLGAAVAALAEMVRFELDWNRGLRCLLR